MMTETEILLHFFEEFILVKRFKLENASCKIWSTLPIKGEALVRLVKDYDTANDAIVTSWSEKVTKHVLNAKACRILQFDVEGTW